MTGHPLILVSAVLFNSLQNLPSAFVSQEEVLRMKGEKKKRISACSTKKTVVFLWIHSLYDKAL